ncbi:MAG TPA: carboxypeptidase-like regulatory domain-containing protein [Bryobacteraceae bacterium]|nr:carboxypeptidase-like regulatory domain-containing protein [Bryobacteraceae bacterium]
MAALVPAPAQVGASVSGRIEDPSGGPVSGASITVTSVETGAKRTVLSDAEGNYSAGPLPLGAQEVRAAKEGFKTAVRTGIDLEVGQNAVVNLMLEVGTLAQEVTVAAEVPIVNTTTSSVSGMVNEQEVKDLPLNGRSFDNLIALNPGSLNYVLKSANTSTSNGNTFAVAGRRPSDNLFLLNGVEYMGSSQLAVTPGGASQELLGIDAVREFNVLTDAYGAEYGKRAGAQVVIVTQSGSNELHGSIFEFLRNSDLDARNFFDRAVVPPFHRNQFGAAMGGPIKKNKLFAFANYEGFRQSLAVSNVSIVPDAEARLGELPNSAGTYVTVANLNPAMLQYMSMWPAPGLELYVNGLPTGAATSYNNPLQSIRENFGTVRPDYILSDRDSLSASYTIDDGYNLSPQADPLFGAVLNLRNQVSSIQEIHTFSPTVVNTATFGYSRAAYTFLPYTYTSFPASDSFVTGELPGGITVSGGLSTNSSSAITAAGTNNAANVWNRRNLFTYTDDVRLNHGIHQLSFGVWFQRLRDNEDTASRQLGVATFASLTTLLQGTVTTFQVVPDANELGWRSLYGAWYLEDVMKLRPNLTVRVGLRDEFNTGWNEVDGRASNYATDSNGVLISQPVVGNSVYSQNNAKLLLGPRVGLAWDPFSNGKTAVRAGFGTYYSMIDALSFLLNSVPPYNGSVSYSSASLPSLLPITPGVPPAQPCGPAVPQPCTIFAPQGIQPNVQTPTVQEWNFTIEHQLGRNTSFRAVYVGSHGYHGLINIDPNTIPAQVCTNTAGCTAGGTPGTTKSTVPFGAQYIPVTTRPDPYLSGGFFWYSEGNSSYNAVQLDITQRLAHGLQFRGNYTRGKNLDINSAPTGAQAQNQAQMVLDRNDISRDWGPSALNVANQATISGSYELPFGHGKALLSGASGAEEKIVGGWQLNGIVTVLSGFPITPQVGSNRSGDGDTRNPDRPNYNPAFTGSIIVGSPTEWYNPNAFVLPAAGTYGNVGRGVLTGPGLADLDISLFKTTHIAERSSLQFRAEFFNALNHPNFASPNATVFSGTSISPSAGLITTTATTSRQIQFGLKLVF